jgi:AcrR family transcriptional regulator
MAREQAVDAPLPEDLRERLVAAGLRVLDEHGPAELTVRRIADAAGSSTMGVYTKFGGRAGVLEAVYRRGFELLRAALAAVPEAADPIRNLLDLALAYRRFALANPALYTFMFEQPLPDYEPSPLLRAESLDTTFELLVAAVRRAVAQAALPEVDPVHTSVLVWCVAHGMVSLELSNSARSPLPGLLPDTPDAGERLLLDGVQATLTGLRHRAPA